jgi:hypothetical protein
MDNRYSSSCKTTPSTKHFLHRCITLIIPIGCQIADERKLSTYTYQCRTMISIIRQYHSSQKSRSSNYLWNMKLLWMSNLDTLTVPWIPVCTIVKCVSIQLRHDRFGTSSNICWIPMILIDKTEIYYNYLCLFCFIVNYCISPMHNTVYILIMTTTT